MRNDKASAHMMKRKGDSGPPCRIPLEGWKGSVGAPLIKTEKDIEEMQFQTSMIHLGGKPICSVTALTNDHSNLSVQGWLTLGINARKVELTLERHASVFSERSIQKGKLFWRKSRSPIWGWQEVNCCTL